MSVSHCTDSSPESAPGEQPVRGGREERTGTLTTSAAAPTEQGKARRRQHPRQQTAAPPMQQAHGSLPRRTAPAPAPTRCPPPSAPALPGTTGEVRAAPAPLSAALHNLLGAGAQPLSKARGAGPPSERRWAARERASARTGPSRRRSRTGRAGCARPPPTAENVGRAGPGRA